MNIALIQRQILTQKLVMTPQLQQAIKLLPMSKLELVGKIQEELNENPALEEARESAVENNINDPIEWHNYLNSE